MTTATAVGYVEMRIAKVVGLRAADDEPFHQYVVLDETLMALGEVPQRCSLKFPTQAAVA